MNRGVLCILVMASRFLLVMSSSMKDGIVVQHFLRQDRQDVDIKLIKRKLSGSSNDDAYIDDTDDYEEENSAETRIGYVINEAEAEMYAIYKNPPSEWSMTEWKVFAVLVTIILAILVCCAAACIRCCCRGSGSERDDSYKNFEDYSTCSSDVSRVSDASLVDAVRRNKNYKVDSNKGQPHSKKDKLLSFDTDDSSVGYDKIMRLRSG